MLHQSERKFINEIFLILHPSSQRVSILMLSTSIVLFHHPISQEQAAAFLTQPHTTSRFLISSIEFSAPTHPLKYGHQSNKKEQTMHKGTEAWSYFQQRICFNSNPVNLCAESQRTRTRTFVQVSEFLRETIHRGFA
jgi:hypothetical protein